MVGKYSCGKSLLKTQVIEDLLNHAWLINQSNHSHFSFTLWTDELSQYIAKFPSHGHDDLISNEYLTTLAYRALLPEEPVVDIWIDRVDGFSEPALIIKRFDRVVHSGRVHFEEFNQLLGNRSPQKYDGNHQEMADFMKRTDGCLSVEIYRLYCRIIVGFLLVNADMHFKNFAMFHTPAGLRLTPTYDHVSAALHEYKSIALALGNAKIYKLVSLNLSIF